MVNAGLFSLALAGFAALAAAQPHRNQHRHVARNNIVTQTTTMYVTVTGSAPDASDAPTPPTVSSIPVPVALTTQSSVSSAVPVVASIPSVISSASSSASSSSSSSASSSASSTASAPAYSAPASPDISIAALSINVATGAGVDVNPNTSRDFPDGQLGCDHFPYEYGAIPLSWVTSVGWSGIQVNGGNGDAVGICTETSLCSYACPAGYSKSQWPEDQPASGESHGGLLCKGGKLHLTRPSFPQLCQPGSSGVTVHNTLSQFVSICRTDYPGSEDMVVPLACPAGSTKPLTVPMSSNSYTWKGLKTSAQYYVNNAGVGIAEGCTWGQQGKNAGNWSPLIFGAGEDSGMMWLSMSQNQLNPSPLNFNVEIIGGNSVCKYENGKFSTPGGCTTAAKPGTSVTYVLY